MNHTINILGTDYTYKTDDLNNPELGANDGICRIYDKEIIVRENKYMSGFTDLTRQRRQDHVIRHELIHAIAEECGVNYGNDEHLVDWIAHIIPIVNYAFNDIKDATIRNEMILDKEKNV